MKVGDKVELFTCCIGFGLCMKPMLVVYEKTTFICLFGIKANCIKMSREIVGSLISWAILQVKGERKLNWAELNEHDFFNMEGKGLWHVTQRQKKAISNERNNSYYH
jgi:hypothetical protein